MQDQLTPNNIPEILDRIINEIADIRPVVNTLPDTLVDALPQVKLSVINLSKFIYKYDHDFKDLHNFKLATEKLDTISFYFDYEIKNNFLFIKYAAIYNYESGKCSLDDIEKYKCCEHCNMPILTLTRHWQKYCTSACRVNAFKAKQSHK